MTNPTPDEQMKMLRHALARANRHEGHIAYVDDPHLNTYQTSVEDYEALVWAGNEYIRAIEDRSSAIRAIHDTATDLYNAGVMGKGTLEEIDKLCLERAAYEHEHLVEELVSALSSLTNEVRGCWGIYEIFLRHEMGNTNYNCVQDRLNTAIEVLAKAKEKK